MIPAQVAVVLSSRLQLLKLLAVVVVVAVVAVVVCQSVGIYAAATTSFWHLGQIKEPMRSRKWGCTPTYVSLKSSKNIGNM